MKGKKMMTTAGEKYGYRGRIGFIAPGSTIETIPYEFYKIVPDGVLIVFTSIGIKRLTREDIKGALEGIESAAAELARTKVNVIILGGSPPIIFGGFGFDQKIIARINTVTDIPATTSQTLAVEALNALRIKKLIVASPFGENQNQPLKKFLQDSGFTVVNIKGLNLPRIEYGMMARDRSFRLAMEACDHIDDFDGIYLPCAQMPTVENIERLEKELGKPVVTSVQAMIWGALKKMNVSENIKGFGQIFQH